MLINNVYDLTDASQDKIRWADSALQIGSDGFEKPLAYLKQMMDGSSQIFAEGSSFKLPKLFFDLKFKAAKACLPFLSPVNLSLNF